MKIKTALLGIASVAVAFSATVYADAEADRKNFVNYFTKKFADVTDIQEYGNGVYAIDKVSRDSWEAIEEFPPYEPFIEEGETMWNTPFKNGKGYGDCFKDGPGQRANYPYWDKERGVVTLPQAVNDCRKANGEEPLKWKKGKIASLLAYMSYESRGQKTNVVIPADDKGAVKAYEDGRHFYYARRGQLNLSCAHCHVAYSGSNLRTDVLSPALGHTTGWPVYRSKWGNLGTLHRRFGGCNKQVRAKPFKAQSEEYRNMEYFLTYMSNGLEYNGPSSRK